MKQLQYILSIKQLLVKHEVLIITILTLSQVNLIELNRDIDF